MLSKPTTDWERGGFYDAFKRETDEPMWNKNKAWWQQTEAIMALTLANLQGVLKDEKAMEARDLGVDFYFNHFVDHKNGGEFDVVDEEGKPTKDTFKGGYAKSTYHCAEFAHFMARYAKGERWVEPPKN